MPRVHCAQIESCDKYIYIVCPCQRIYIYIVCCVIVFFVYFFVQRLYTVMELLTVLTKIHIFPLKQVMFVLQEYIRIYVWKDSNLFAKIHEMHENECMKAQNNF